MESQRLSERLTTYWNNTRKDQPFPDFAQFNASALDDIMQQCVLFTVQPSVEGRPQSISFYRVGDKVKALYGSDMVGRSFNPTQRVFQGATIMRKLPEMLAAPAPITDHGQFVNERSKMVKYRSCMLPFGRNGAVTHIMTGLSWKEF